jgi:hypothetical protein
MRKERILFGMLALLISLCFGVSLVFSQGCERGGKETQMKVDKEQLRAERVLAENESKLMSIPGVVGVGMGLTEKGDRPAIHVYVNVETTDGTIPAAIPNQIDNIAVRVIETDEIKAW